MIESTQHGHTPAVLRPMVIIVGVVALVGLAIWQIGPKGSPKENPFLEDIVHTPALTMQAAEGS
ncbi:hypothetical protein [Marivita geojedonensis]|uniref:Uncharacterized protein n=1 Tax=Marivita geojedonensis TaxID=1123756 RepID=A0A1X4NL13_9RHOB|nr:hypothetical protein [Marivita geojedonensis]OSQ50950.1 hypothetical protein MGEO_09460 [Marivita geojedonensis]